MRSSEWLSLVYFGALAALGCVRPLPAARRIQITAASIAMAAAIVSAAHYGGTLVRDWAPGVSILVGYYLSGRFFVRPSRRFEDWLRGVDRRLFGDPTTRFARWPPSLLACLEILYVHCFLLVPGGLAALALAGRSSLADRYWTMVAAAEFGSFAPLSVIQTRPPWLVEKTAALPDRAVHRFAASMVERFTIRANTFPSGHVAGSLAVAFAVIGALPWLGAVLLVLATGIAVACVVGRYHYVVDVVAGAVLALSVWATVGLMSP